MPTVRDVTFDLLRGLEMTTVFGNPGSTEEPFLTEFPDDFQYILGLHEAAVVAMADGFAQASGNAAFVNLHTASGVGNGMGALFTAWHNRTPLVMTAGQQTRQMLALEPWLVSREATELPRPYVKWSHEPARAEDVPAAIERAYHIAMAPPRGPVFVSIPMDDWNAPAAPRPARRVSSLSRPDEDALNEAAAALAAKTLCWWSAAASIAPAAGTQQCGSPNGCGRRCGSPGAGARLLPANAPLVSRLAAAGHEAAGGAPGGARRGAARRRPGLSLPPAHSRANPAAWDTAAASDG